MFKLIAALLTALVVGTMPASANEKMTLVVGFSAGGNSTRLARIIAHSIEQITGETPTIENRPGAGGALAAEWVRRQAGSRTLLFMASTSLLKVPPDTGLVPVGIIAQYRFVAIAKRGVAADMADYLSKASRDDRLRNVATPGAGSIPHLIGTKMFKERGMTMVHVPFQGANPAVQAVLGDHVPLAIVPYTDFLPFKDHLQIIGETGDRIGSENGWQAIYAPPGTSHEEVDRLSRLFEQASQMSKDALERDGYIQVWMNADQLLAIHRREHSIWAPLAESLGVKQ